MNSISDVVDVTIAIEEPATDSNSFSKLLLVVARPKNSGTEDIPNVVSIKKADDLKVYGYDSTEDAYKAANVAFSQDPKPQELFVVARKVGADKENEPIAECLDRAARHNEWYGFSLIGFSSTTDLQAAAEWAEANSRLFGFTYISGSLPIVTSSYTHTFAFYAGSISASEYPDGNTYAAVAYMAKCFGYDPGSETWNLKSLNGVKESLLPAGKVHELKNAKTNFYRNIANKSVTQEGKVGSGEWIDVIRFKDWLLNKIQIEVFDFMTKNGKVAFNDSGITGIQNVLEAVLSAAQRLGGIDEDRYDENENLERGYIVTAPRSSNISAAEKKNRKLTGVSFVARLSGAIHEVAIRGTLIY